VTGTPSTEEMPDELSRTVLVGAPRSGEQRPPFARPRVSAAPRRDASSARNSGLSTDAGSLS
jgi:hypothetical protein